ncbi:uncharacterized protein BYT42DRAFT_632494 [Radiomyces spectabilis]|uniref:uncharacterized protein n=1 Tax=Radiomyces spectabilis TaxID=64574 RepID=UPI00221F9ED2|nr:uncharacterized protein BYT42DRAFT_632494 [Radiomyces spectabilis]KAI8384285.1 hypothetical protein BYT42DRAFT_632494 [Radiomyces spectabilis]
MTLPPPTPPYPSEKRNKFGFPHSYWRRRGSISTSSSTDVSESVNNGSVVDHKTFTPRTYPQAWLALFLLVLLRIAVSVFQFTFSVIPSLTGQFLGVSLTAVNWLANVQGLAYVFLSFFTGWIFERLGVKRSVSLANEGFCSNEKKILITSNYGAILLYIVLIIAAVAFVPLLFMPAQPPTPPSRVQDHKKPAFIEGLCILSRNYNFWILFLIHGFNVGLSIAFGTIFTQVVAPYGYSDAQAGQLNAIAFFAGTLGCSVAGPVLDMTKQHKLFLRLISPMVLVTDLGFIFISKQKRHTMLSICTHSLSSTYPVAEATTSSILWQGAQIFGFLALLIMDAVRDPQGNPPNTMYNALIFQAAVAGLIMILSFLFRGKMARTEAIQLAQQKVNGQEKPPVPPLIAGINAAYMPSAETVIGIKLSDPPVPSSKSSLETDDR